jgi:hypothetical protein
MIQKDIDFS